MANNFYRDYKVPEMPKDNKSILKALWRAVFNDIPHMFCWQDKRIDWLFRLLTILVAMQGIAIGLISWHMATGG